MNIEAKTKGAIDNASSQATDVADEAIDKGRKIFARTVDQVVPAMKETLSDVEARANDFLSGATDQIKKHPIQSLLIGFGVGALLGVALRGIRRAA